jgi:hypothetical protein
VVIERLRTEATTWINAVALQAGRIDRRHRMQYLESPDAAAIEIDLHFFLVALIRLRRCVERVAKRLPELRAALRQRVETFDESVPSLVRLRNVSEHIDEYNLDEGRDVTVSRRQVQTWYMDTGARGGLIWGWIGERLDVQIADEAAVVLYRGFAADCDAWIAHHQ